jgi:hypothetical protein
MTTLGSTRAQKSSTRQLPLQWNYIAIQTEFLMMKMIGIIAVWLASWTF